MKALALFFALIFFAFGTGHAVAQSDNYVTFKAGVHLVMVPVVVRDSTGQVVGNVTKEEDFQLFDKGKRQQITKFTVEKSGGQVAYSAESHADKRTEQPAVGPASFIHLRRETGELSDPSGGTRRGRPSDSHSEQRGPDPVTELC